jgi:hypothetical protein
MSAALAYHLFNDSPRYFTHGPGSLPAPEKQSSSGFARRSF